MPTLLLMMLMVETKKTKKKNRREIGSTSGCPFAFTLLRNRFSPKRVPPTLISRLAELLYFGKTDGQNVHALCLVWRNLGNNFGQNRPMLSALPGSIGRPFGSWPIEPFGQRCDVT